MSQISSSTFTQSSAGRQPSEQPFDSTASLNKAIEFSSTSLIAQRSKLHSSEEALAKASFIDSVSGNKILYEADRDQEQSKYDKFVFGHKQLIEAKTKVDDLLAQGKTAEAAELSSKALAKHKKLLKSELGANQTFQDLCDEQIKNLEQSERRTQIVADTAVAAAATVATLGAGGAVISAGVAVKAVVGTIAAKNVFAGAVDLANGTSGTESLANAGTQVAKDSFIAAKATVSAAVGGGVARSLATPLTTVAKAGVASAAGVSATATSLTINLAERTYTANKSFEETYGSWLPNMSVDERTRLAREHYKAHGLDFDTVAKEMVIDLTVGAVAGGQGGVASAAREATKSGIGRAIITSTEVGGTVVIGAIAAHAKHGKLNQDALLEGVAPSALATLAGGVVTSNSKTVQVAPVSVAAKAVQIVSASPNPVKHAEPQPAKTVEKPIVEKPVAPVVDQPEPKPVSSPVPVAIASKAIQVVTTIPSPIKQHSFHPEKAGTKLAGTEVEVTGVELKYSNNQEVPIVLHKNMKFSASPGQGLITVDEISHLYVTKWRPMLDDGVKVARGDAAVRHTGSGLIHIREDHFQAQKVERLIQPNVNGVGYKQQTASLFPHQLSNDQIITIMREGLNNPNKVVVSNINPSCLNVFGKINNPKLAPGITEVRITVDNETGVLTMTPTKGDYMVATLVPVDKVYASGDKVAMIKNTEINNQEGSNLKVVYTTAKGVFVNETGPKALSVGNNN